MVLHRASSSRGSEQATGQVTFFKCRWFRESLPAWCSPERPFLVFSRLSGTRSTPLMSLSGSKAKHIREHNILWTVLWCLCKQTQSTSTNLGPVCSQPLRAVDSHFVRDVHEWYTCVAYPLRRPVCCSDVLFFFFQFLISWVIAIENSTICWTILHLIKHTLLRVAIMSDPLSIIASVAGLTGFGLKICTTVTNYLDAIKSRSQEIERAKQEVQTIRHLLTTIENSRDKISSCHESSKSAVGSCLATCNMEIAALEALVSELQNSAAGGQDSRIWHNIRDQGKKLTYSFHRSKLERLQAQLAKVTGTLQVALQVAEM